MVSIFRETNIYIHKKKKKKKIHNEGSCVNRATMLSCSTQRISKSIVPFFFFETILFNLQKKKKEKTKCSDESKGEEKACIL